MFHVHAGLISVLCTCWLVSNLVYCSFFYLCRWTIQHVLYFDIVCVCVCVCVCVFYLFIITGTVVAICCLLLFMLVETTDVWWGNSNFFLITDCKKLRMYCDPHTRLTGFFGKIFFRSVFVQFQSFFSKIAFFLFRE